jgi:hypothetical protein
MEVEKKKKKYWFEHLFSEEVRLADPQWKEKAQIGILITNVKLSEESLQSYYESGLIDRPDT